MSNTPGHVINVGSLLARMGAIAGLRTASLIAAGLILVVAALNFAAR
jgi:hypothetical protein